MLRERKNAGLIKAAVKGDQQAFTELIDGYRQTMYATAMAITHDEDDAMDAIQDTLLTLWEKLGTLQEPAYFKTWMTRILINKCYSMFRGTVREFPMDELENMGSASDDPGAALDTSMDVRRTLSELSDSDRLILQLFYLEDLSVKDIAASLNVSPETVRMRLTRGRKRFRQRYEKGGAV